MLLKIITTYRTLVYAMLALSLSLNYLVYMGKIDMFGAGIAQASNQQSADYLTTLAADEPRPVVLKTKKGVK